MLQYTNVRLELLTDYNMLLFFKRVLEEKSQCVVIDMLKPIIFVWTIMILKNLTLIYLDVVNLYGWAMCLNLQTSDFK